MNPIKKITREAFFKLFGKDSLASKTFVRLGMFFFSRKTYDITKNHGPTSEVDDQLNEKAKKEGVDGYGFIEEK